MSAVNDNERQMTLQAETVRKSLREFILADFLFSDDPTALNDDDSFQETQIIDSMGMIQVVQFIESEYQLKVKDEELVPEKLDSVNRLVRFVTEKKTLPEMPGTTLVHLLARSVESRPDAIAIVAGERRVSYAELWDAVSRGVEFLRDRTIVPGDRVALLMRNSPDYAACYYAVLAAGGVVVPLNLEAKIGDLDPLDSTQRDPHGHR